MTTVLTIYGIFATFVAAWALIELKAERISSRMVDEFRENDRKFYRKWEDIWFTQLNEMPAKPTVKKAAKKVKVR